MTDRRHREFRSSMRKANLRPLLTCQSDGILLKELGTRRDRAISVALTFNMELDDLFPSEPIDPTTREGRGGR
jgi:hypothetical protein